VFDNRYWAKLPTAENLKGLGVRHILYVNPGGNDVGELDDLNDEFVALDQAGIDVKTVALTDFVEAVDAQPMYATGWNWDISWSIHFYFGGCSWWHHAFWQLYGWHCPPGRPRIRIPPPHVSGGCHYKPIPRRTIFAGAPPRGTWARQHWRPARFARVQTRTSRWDGRLTGVHFGRTVSATRPSFTRSGSLGRIGATFAGG
jgi:hypothetical protein